MPRDGGVPLSLNEKSFILFALKNNQRIDGRGLYDMRNLHISFGKELGTVEVQLGATRVMTCIQAELGTPFSDRTTEGTFSVYTEFSPMADPKFEQDKRSEDAVELGRLIDRSLRGSKALDLESLCVQPGKAVWNLRLDIHILDNNGNLVDVANFSSIISLLSFRRPECSIDSSLNIIVHPIEERDPIPLSLHHIPLSITFAFFNDGEDMIIDPNLKEELCSEGKLILSMNIQGEICTIQKAGGVPINPSEIVRAARIAAEKVLELTEEMKLAVEANEKERQLAKVKRKKNAGVEENKDALFSSNVVLTDKDLNEFKNSIFSHKSSVNESLEGKRKEVKREEEDGDKKDEATIDEEMEGEVSNVKGIIEEEKEEGEVEEVEEEEEEEEEEEDEDEEEEEEENDKDNEENQMEVDNETNAKKLVNELQKKKKNIVRREYFEGDVSSWFMDDKKKEWNGPKITSSESPFTDEYAKVAELLSPANSNLSQVSAAAVYSAAATKKQTSASIPNKSNSNDDSGISRLKDANQVHPVVGSEQLMSRLLPEPSLSDAIKQTKLKSKKKKKGENK